MIRFFDPGRAYLKHQEEILGVIDDVLTKGDLILRQDVEIFEEDFAKFTGAKYAVGVGHGTDAIALSLKAVGVQPGDEVLTSSYTFRATLEAIDHVGGVPRLFDLGEEPKITPETKAFIPVHMEGRIYPFTDFNVPIVEDSCQAVTKSVEGDTACYSFYPAKILGGMGDAGAITTNNKEIYEELLGMRNHYKEEKYADRGYGYNSRLDNVQAAILNVKLKYLPEQIKRRKEIAEMYDKNLPNEITPEERDLYQDYIVQFDSKRKRDHMYNDLEAVGVETMKNGYTFPVGAPKLPVAEDYENRSLRLPIQPELVDEEIQAVCDQINRLI